MAQKMIGRLTEEQYDSLPGMGREIHSYWRNYKKKLYKDMADSGELYPYLMKEGERLEEMVISLMQNGMDQAGALEVARAEYNEDMMY